MARASMADIIARTRVLIADGGSPPALTDDQIQDALDARRTERRWIALQTQPTFVPGGIRYLDYYADVGNWEADVVLQDVSYITITPTLSELLIGHWAFAAQPNGIAVHATGKTYDVYGSAADLLEAWAAQVKLDFAFVADRDAFSRDQKCAMMRSLAADYRKQAQPLQTRVRQSDDAPDGDTIGVTYPSQGSY